MGETSATPASSAPVAPTVPFAAISLSVLHLTASNARRGAETFAVDLVEALAARNIDGVLRSVTDSPLSNRLAIDPLPGGRWSWRGMRELRGELRRVDIAVGHGSSSLAALALATSVAPRTPFAYRGIGDPVYWSSTAFQRARTSRLLRRAAAVTAVWPGAADVLVERLAVPRERVHVVPRGVPTQRFPLTTPEARRVARASLDLDEAAPVVAVVSSLTAEKRVDRAIDALAALPDVRALIAGDGPLRRELEASAAARAPGRVHFLGAIERPVDVYAAADVLLLTSDTEGLPGVVVEAAFTGLPTVATAVGGVVDVVVDGETGYIVPPGDHDALVARACDAIASRSSMGAAARRYCLERFDLERVADRWEGILRMVGER